MRKLHRFLALTLGLAVAGAAAANTVYTLDTTLNGASVSATADFSIDAANNTISLSLANTTGSIDQIIETLTGITFTVSGNPTLKGVTGVADGSISCIGVADGAACNASDSDVDVFGSPPDVDGNSHNAAPEGWAFLPNYALFTFGAGGGSFKPWGIVNDDIRGSGSNGTTSNPQHNPMLLGPVTFTFTFDDFLSTPTINGVQFYWGSGGDHRGGVCTVGCNVSELLAVAQVPEPRTLALVALALIGMTVSSRLRIARRA
jgi:hypothetical protein